MQDKAALRSTMISADTDGFLGHPAGSYKNNRYGKTGGGGEVGRTRVGVGRVQDGGPGRTAELLPVPRKISRITDRNSDHKALPGALSCLLSLFPPFPSPRNPQPCLPSSIIT